MADAIGRLRRAVRDLRLMQYSESRPLDGLRMLPLGTEVPPGEMQPPAPGDPRWQPIAAGAHWGGQDQTVWFAAEAEIPAGWRAGPPERFAVVLRLLLGLGERDFFGWPEGLLYVNDRLTAGLNRHHADVLLPATEGPMALRIRAWSGILPPDHRLEYAEVSLLDRQCEHFAHLLEAGSDVINLLPPTDPVRAPLLAALDAAYNHVDLSAGTAAFDATLATALERLHADLADLRARFTPPGSPAVTAIGHGHLDVAWLWQTRHTREKTARTFSIATALQQHYPEYHFLHTTPQVFAWLREDYPDLYARVRERVAEGRFEAGGALWLESDCNLVRGESLVRQVLYGQRFLREEFGREYSIAWLPDAFGYSAALPQILLRAGLPIFLTTKMSWSETNRIPADTFRWRGLDGSEILAHFVTTPTENPHGPLGGTDTYNGALTAYTMRGLWERYRDKAVNAELLLVFGHGDGGAGPTRQFLEQARALQAMPGVPTLRLGRADEHLEALRARVWDDPRLRVWDGELYLEYHRGTYTTQAWLKRLHRQCERDLLAAEALDALLLPPSSAGELDDAWRMLLLHEFHDILPGSSIGPVYADARRDLGALAGSLAERITDRLRSIAASAEAAPGDLLVYNTAPHPQAALVALSSGESQATWRAAEADAPLPAQAMPGGGALLAVPEVPARGYRLLRRGAPEADAEQQPPETVARVVGERVLENTWFRLEFTEQGEIGLLLDTRVPGGRSVFRAGEVGNRILAFEDRPRLFDAWDIDATYEQKAYPTELVALEVVERGPLRATVRVTRRIGQSTITQDISLYATLPRIDFATRITWAERQLLLKAAFPLDLRSTAATYEVQYGAVERPTHRNTSWDEARFEVYAHRWVDCAEPGYGVSLLNDGRYGHDAHGATLRLTLLRSPILPDPQADLGEHHFTYSLLPHLGDWRAAGTVAAAAALNEPLRSYVVPAGEQRPAPPLPALRSSVAATPANVVVEAVKHAADGSGLIVRLYEAHGARCAVRVTCARPVHSVEECDLLERPLRPGATPAYDLWLASAAASHDEPQPLADGWTCALRPFEVRTFRVVGARPA